MRSKAVDLIMGLLPSAAKPRLDRAAVLTGRGCMRTARDLKMLYARFRVAKVNRLPRDALTPRGLAAGYEGGRLRADVRSCVCSPYKRPSAR